MREGDGVLGIYDYGQFYRVGFFGHRYIDGYREVEARLEKLLREILRVKPFVECYVGRNGDFDQMVAKTATDVILERSEGSRWRFF